uniref:Protein kinase domain-containing protein n=1 Tax=Plectus sambesii TaxID=2011161 RepID=A0A914V536_9BILA
MADASPSGKPKPGRLRVQWPPPPIPATTILRPKPVNPNEDRKEIQDQPAAVDNPVQYKPPPVPNNPSPVQLVPEQREDEHKVEETQARLDNARHQPPAPQVPTDKWMPKKRKNIEKLGEGAFGIVYKCCDTDSLRLFAAKETIIRDQADMQIAENEVERLKCLNHKHVVEYYGSVKEHNAIVIYMEYFPAGSLRDMIDNVGALEESTAIAYIRQILDGLAYIHSMLILHCDLKCANLLLDGHGSVKIGDFGIAVQMCLDNANQSVFMLGAVGGGGTLYWMAPEVIRQEKDSQGKYGRTADIWSLACTIVEMLTTLPPYCIEYSSEARFMGAMCTNSLSYKAKEIVPDASVPMQLFLSRLFVYDPKDRLRYGADAKEKFQEEFPP